MACGCAILQLRVIDDVTVRVTGTLDGTEPCPWLAVTVHFPDGARTAAADVSSGDWTATFEGFDPVRTKAWCEAAMTANAITVLIEAQCIDNGAVLCTHAESRVLHCCARFQIIGVQNGPCLPTNDGTYRPYTYQIRVDWPAGSTEVLSLRLAVAQPGSSAPGAERTLAVSPGTALYDFELTLRADRDYAGTLGYVTPAHCAGHDRTVARFHVPACNCDSSPNPADFFILTDLQGTEIIDPNDSGCVPGDKVTVSAASGPVTWKATTFGEDVPTERVDDLKVRVPLPADGRRVIVTATLTRGDCVFPISVSAVRCPCVPLPDDYTLKVLDENGTEVAGADCVRGPLADVVAPDHEGDVSWTLDGQPAAASPETPRSLRVNLDADEHTVTARVGIGTCVKSVSRTLRRCQEGVLAVKERFWPAIPWCLFMMIGGLLLFFAGHILFTIGACVLLLWPCFIDGAVALATPTGGLAILAAVIIYWIFVIITFVGALMSVVGVILIVVWLFRCRGCDGIKSPISMCEMLRLCAWLLGFGTFFTILLDSLLVWAASVVSGVCGTVFAGVAGFLFALLGSIPWLIDMGALAVVNFIIYYYGNAIGCFNSWPTSLIPIIPLPAASSTMPCPDESTP